MTTKSRYLSAVLTAIVLAGSAVSAHADDTRKASALRVDNGFMASSFAAPNKTRNLLAQRQISASDAKSIALRRVRGGEVVDISKRGDTYRVRVIAKNGRVVDVYIDANSGRVKR